MVHIEGRIGVGHVFVDGDEIDYKGPGIPRGVQWLHVIPEEYYPSNLERSTINCFTDTLAGRTAMREWLTSHCLLRSYEYSEAIHMKIEEYLESKAFETNKECILKAGALRLLEDTGVFHARLKANRLDPSDPELLEKLNDPAILIKGPILNCSIVYEGKNCTGDSMPVPDGRSYPDLSQIVRTIQPPPVTTWDNCISSVSVQTGKIMLFDVSYFKNPQLILYGPLKSYNLDELCFDNVTSSLRQLP